MTVTPPGAADRPSATAPPATEIDEVTVSGDATPTTGVVATYSAAASGTTSDFTYTWGLGGGETVASGYKALALLQLIDPRLVLMA